MSGRISFRHPTRGSTDQEIAQLTRWARSALPSSYVSLLRETNGGEHSPSSDVLVLWTAAEVEELTEAYGAPTFAPGLVLIGSDGGGEAVAFDTQASQDPEAWPVVVVPFGDLDRASCIRLAASFDAWLTAGLPLSWPKGGGRALNE